MKLASVMNKRNGEIKKKMIRISTVPCSLETFCKGVLRELAGEYEVVAVSSPGEDLDVVGRREGVRTVAVPMARHIALFRDVVSLWRLIVLFVRERPDIVHSMTPKAGLLAMVAAWLTRVPVRMHTFTGLVFPTTTGLKRKILMAMDSLTCFCANYINPEGKGVKRDLERHGITRKPLHIIANGNVRGVDMDWYARTPEVEVQAATLRKPGTFTFCFVGRLVADKGINELAEAFRRLADEHENVRLLLVGRFEEKLDPLQPDALQLIQSHPRIETVGQQFDVRPYLAAADAFVFPSYREGFPNVVLEAGALGLPSIVTDINGSNEIIVNGQNGEIIPSRDAEALYRKMKEWVERSAYVEVLAANARQMVEDRYEQRMIWNALRAEYHNLSK